MLTLRKLTVALGSVLGVLVGAAPSAGAFSDSPYCYWYIAGWDWLYPIVLQRCYVL